VPEDAHGTLFFSPSAVAVHDDGDVSGQAVKVNMFPK
jgi:hypothetical protein